MAISRVCDLRRQKSLPKHIIHAWKSWANFIQYHFDIMMKLNLILTQNEMNLRLIYISLQDYYFLHQITQWLKTIILKMMNRELHARLINYLSEYLIEIYFNGMIKHEYRTIIASDEKTSTEITVNLSFTCLKLKL